MPEVQLVRMVRDAESGGPMTADVHPAEVKNYELGNWKVADEAEANQPVAENAGQEKPRARQRKARDEQPVAENADAN